DQPLRALGESLRRRTASALVDAHLVAALAALQHVNRKPRGLACDIPQRMLDAADGGIDDRAAREAGEVVHGGPQVLDIAWILADQPRFEIFDSGDRRFVRADGIGFAPAGDALVGQNLDEAEIAAFDVDEERLDVGDLERRLARVSRRYLRLKRHS